MSSDRSTTPATLSGAPEVTGVRGAEAAETAPARHSALILVGYLLVGIYFGIVLTKSEAVSWFRIQEMFRFQSFHMYGILGSGVAVAALTVRLIQRLGIRALSGEPIRVAPKECGPTNYRYWLGGGIFGLGWGLLGACPGPIYTLIGAGVSVAVVALAAALAGTWLYGLLRSRLPHY